MEDLVSIADLLCSTFYAKQGWRSLFTPVLKMGLFYELTARLQNPNSQIYQCLVAEVPYATSSQTKIIVGTVEIGLRFLNTPSPNNFQTPYISNLAVDSAYRQQGIGRLLLQRCESIAAQWSQPNVYLHVRPDNRAALSLYTQLEYRPVSQFFSLDRQRQLLRKQLRLS